MTTVLLSCFDVFLLRVGPQAFPRSRVLLAVALLVYLLTDTLVNWVQGYSAVPMVLESLFDSVYWLAAFALALGIGSVWPRLEQTLSAWYGVENLFNLVSLPIAAVGRMYLGKDAPAWLFVPAILLFLWSMVVMANLLHHALRRNYAVSVVVAAACVTLNYGIATRLFPAP